MNNKPSEFSELYQDARSGNKYAVDILATDYLLPNIMKFAKNTLKNMPTPVEDHSDLAQSIMGSMWREIREGKHSTMEEDHFFGLFYTIAKRKAVKKLRFYLAGKRDERIKVGENQGSEADYSPIMQNAVSELDDIRIDESEVEFQGSELLRKIGEELGNEISGGFVQLVNELDPISHQVLELQMTTSKTQAEIAGEIGRSIALVEGRVRIIKKKIGELEN